MDLHKLQVQIEGNYKPFKDACNKVKQEAKKTTDYVKKVTSGQTDAYEDLKSKIAKGLTGKNDPYDRLVKSIKKYNATKLQKKYDSGYLKFTDEARQKIDKIKKESQETAKALDRINAKLSIMETKGKVNTPEYNKTVNLSDAYASKLGGYDDQLNSIFSSRSSYQSTGKLTKLQMIGSKIGSTFKKTFKSITSGLANVGKQAAITGKKLFRMALLFSLGGRLIMGVIRSIKEGFNNLVQYDNQANKSVSELKNSLTQLKNSFATAFAPILNVVTPALVSLINMCNRALTAIGSLFSALTGASQTVRAVKITDDYADSLKNASDNAESMNDNLQSFDKINKLSEDKTSGTTQASDMFETIDIGANTKTLAEQLKKAWADADFTEVGRNIGKKITESLDSINWENIREKVNKVAKSIATYINGMFEGLNFSTLAKTISNAIITTLNGVSTFLENVNWQNIGKSIVDFICGIDYAGLFKAAFRTLGGVVGGIAGIIAGAIKECIARVKDYGGGDIVQGLFLGIKNAISNIGKWIKDNIFTPFITGFKKAFGINSPSTVMATMGGYIIDGLRQGIVNKWNTIKEWYDANIAPKLTLKYWKDKANNIKIAFESLSIRLKTPHLSWTSTPLSTSSVYYKILSALGLPTSLPKLNVAWYKQGGVLEDGLFTMNRGEIAGKFDNGTSVVANNKMITTGIANAVYPAVYNAITRAMANGNGSNVEVTISGDMKNLFKAVQKEARNYSNMTGAPAF